MLSVRLAERDGLIYLDLADEFWRCVEIGANGWRIPPSGQLRRTHFRCQRPGPRQRQRPVALAVGYLCRLTSGRAFSTRRLFTDQDESLFAPARPIILNGIEDIIIRPDLADRATLLSSHRLPNDSGARRLRFGGNSKSHDYTSLAHSSMRSRTDYVPPAFIPAQLTGMAASL